MRLEDYLSGNVLVTASTGDIDACSSFVAFDFIAKKLSKAKLTFSVFGNTNKGGKKILDIFNFKVKDFSKINLDKIDKVILLDSQINLLPKELKDLDLIIIDHHSHGKKGKYVLPDAVSTTEIIYQIAKENKIKLNKKVAKALVFGIIADTGGMRFAKNNTFSLLYSILSEYSLDYQNILSELSEEIDMDAKLAWIKAAQRIKIRQINNKIILTSYVGSYESSTAQKLMVLGADVALVLSRKKDNTRIVGRSKKGIDLAKIFINVTKILSKSTGGGHPSAAVLTVPKKEEKQAVAEILKWISKI